MVVTSFSLMQEMIAITLASHSELDNDEQDPSLLLNKSFDRNVKCHDEIILLETKKSNFHVSDENITQTEIPKLAFLRMMGTDFNINEMNGQL